MCRWCEEPKYDKNALQIAEALWMLLAKPKYSHSRAQQAIYSPVYRSRREAMFPMKARHFSFQTVWLQAIEAT